MQALFLLSLLLWLGGKAVRSGRTIVADSARGCRRDMLLCLSPGPGGAAPALPAAFPVPQTGHGPAFPQVAVHHRPAGHPPPAALLPTGLLANSGQRLGHAVPLTRVCTSAISSPTCWRHSPLSSMLPPKPISWPRRTLTHSAQRWRSPVWRGPWSMRGVSASPASCCSSFLILLIGAGGDSRPRPAHRATHVPRAALFPAVYRFGH